MKTLLLSVSSLACGVVLGFVLNTLLFFGDFRWPGKLPEPKAVGEELASPSYGPPVNSAPPKLVESIRLVPNKDSLSETAGQASQSSSTVGSVLGQQDNSDADIFAELSYEVLTEFSPESSISDQQQLLALIANADLAQIMQAYNEIPGDNNRIHDQQWVIGLLAQRRVELDP